MPPRIVFMGSPEFALPSLESLAGRYPVVGVVTQPDRPAGRGRKLAPPPVKVLAERLGLPVLQPARLKEAHALEQLQSWRPDLIVVAAFGQILRKEVLELPPYGCINVHASLLPRWRGAAPVQAAILHGDQETGITIMKMDEGLDTGPILSQRSLAINPEDTGGSLSERLARLGAELLADTLPGYLDGSLAPVPQDERFVTFAPRLDKTAGALDFQQPAADLARLVRAYHPWPGAYTYLQEQRLKILKAHAANGSGGKPGETAISGGKPAFVTTDGLLVLDEVQLAGKLPVPGEVFLRSGRGW
jgi:methionyl-tRNA formyltransferase